VLELKADFPSLEETSKISYVSVGQDLAELRNGLHQIRQTVEKMTDDIPGSERFNRAFRESILADFDEQLSNMEQDLGTIREKFAELEERFGGEKSNNLEEFFVSFNHFVTNFTNTRFF
jgi:septation ring formation regulator EzrA